MAWSLPLRLLHSRDADGFDASFLPHIVSWGGVEATSTATVVWVEDIPGGFQVVTAFVQAPTDSSGSPTLLAGPTPIYTQTSGYTYRNADVVVKPTSTAFLYALTMTDGSGGSGVVLMLIGSEGDLIDSDEAFDTVRGGNLYFGVKVAVANTNHGWLAYQQASTNLIELVPFDFLSGVSLDLRPDDILISEVADWVSFYGGIYDRTVLLGTQQSLAFDQWHALTWDPLTNVVTDHGVSSMNSTVTLLGGDSYVQFPTYTQDMISYTTNDPSAGGQMVGLAWENGGGYGEGANFVRFDIDANYDFTLTYAYPLQPRFPGFGFTDHTNRSAPCWVANSRALVLDYAQNVVSPSAVTYPNVDVITMGRVIYDPQGIQDFPDYPLGPNELLEPYTDALDGPTIYPTNSVPLVVGAGGMYVSATEGVRHGASAVGIWVTLSRFGYNPDDYTNTVVYYVFLDELLPDTLAGTPGPPRLEFIGPTR